MSSKANPPTVPPELLGIQKWFASIITRPIDQNSQMISLSPSGCPMEQEAPLFISPGRKLSSAARIQIYNQQYWWRLLTILHRNFPTLTRLFGYTDFNLSIAMPFLTRYPSRHWSLAKLGDQLTAWLKEYYLNGDKELILAVAEVDWAYQALFFAPPPTYLLPSTVLLSEKLCFQSHVKLFRFPFDIFSLREALLKKTVEFWMEAPDFPPLCQNKTHFHLLYRMPNTHSVYREIGEGQWTLLNSIEKGLTIEEACEALERQGGAAYEEAAASLDLWVQEWMRQGWLIPK